MPDTTRDLPGPTNATCLSGSPTILLQPHYPALTVGRTNTFVMLIRIQAPDAAENMPSAREARLPQSRSLALVIDASGSMNGKSLHQAKRCASMVVAAMKPNDRVALVQFDSEVKTLWPAAEVGDGQSLDRVIRSIQSGGFTDLHGGWAAGAKALESAPATGLRRVMLLSDGRANRGITNEGAIEAHCAEQAAHGITTSTYGLGNRFHEDLMVGMSRAGGGNQYYGHTAEDLMAPFLEEMDLMASLYLRNVTLSVTCEEGVKIDMLNDWRTTEGGWRLQDLALGSEGWALVRVTVPAHMARLGVEPIHLLTVDVQGTNDQGERLNLHSAQLRMTGLTPEDHDRLPPDDLVTRRQMELAAAQALRNMRAAAQAGNWEAVAEMLKSARAEFASNEWVMSILATMENLAAECNASRVGKEMMYASSKLGTRLRAKNEMRMVEGKDAGDTPRYLVRSSEQGRTK